MTLPDPAAPGPPTSSSPAAGTAPPPPAVERLLDVYRRWFEVVVADTDALRDEVYRLRYRVLAVEHPYLDPDDYPDGCERDEHDAHSAHALLVHRPSGAVAGTVRVILPHDGDEARRLPILDHCADPRLHDPAWFPASRAVEVSRFSISKQFRRRLTDAFYPDALEERIGEAPEADEARRVMPNIMLGIIQAAIALSAANGLTWMSAMMEKQLIRLLARVGIHLDAVGPPVDLYGLRQPCVRNWIDMVDQVRAEGHDDVWEVLTDDGRLWDRLVEIGRD